MSDDDDDPTPLVREQRHVTLAVADAVLRAAVERAESLGVAAVIVVTDAAGGIVRLARLDGAPPIAIRHALGKASSASGMGRTTDEFLDKRLTQDDVLWRAISGRGDAFVTPGGAPLKVDGRRSVRSGSPRRATSTIRRSPPPARRCWRAESGRGVAEDRLGLEELLDAERAPLATVAGLLVAAERGVESAGAPLTCTLPLRIRRAIAGPARSLPDT